MKTKYTIIIGLISGDESEVIDSVCGLFLGKIHNEGGPICISDPGFPSSSEWAEYINKAHSLDKNDIQSILEDDIGVYIVSHGAGNNVGGLTASQLAELIRELGFRFIRKICLVACVAGKSLGDAKVTGMQSDIDQSYIGSFCRELYPMTPMVAGYTGFITVAHPKYSGRIGVPGDKGWNWCRNHGSKAVGRKIIKNQSARGRATVMTPDARKNIKVIAQTLDGNSVQLVDHARWHDS